jgi:hypothetical protein
MSGLKIFLRKVEKSSGLGNVFLLDPIPVGMNWMLVWKEIWTDIF